MPVQNEVTDLFDGPTISLGEAEADAGLQVEAPQITPPPSRGTSEGNRSGVRTKEQIEEDRLAEEMAREQAQLGGGQQQQPPSTGTVVAPGQSPAGGQQPPAGVQPPVPPTPPAAAPVTTTPPPAATVPVGDMTTAMVEALKASGLLAQPQAPAAAADVPLTQDQIDERLGVWKPSEDWIKRVQDPDKMHEALAEMQTGTVRQSVRMAYALAEEFVAKQLGPIQQAIDSLRPAAELAERTRSQEVLASFHQRHPLLADPNLAPIVKQAYATVKQSGKQFDSQESAFDAIAETATAVIRAVKPDFGTQPPPSGQPTTTSQQQQPTTTTAAPIPVPPPTGGATGGGTGGGGSSSKPQKNEVEDIWGTTPARR